MIVSAPEIKEPGGAHWYTAAGEPMHEVDNAKGDGKRATTLRDARKLDLYPSVTGIIKILDKWALNEWKIEQALMAADKHPRNAGEAFDAYMARVRSVADQQVTDARIEGAAIHAAIENYYSGRRTDEKYDRHVGAVIDQIGDRDIRLKAEQSFSCDLGYGGAADLYDRLDNVVYDFKSKDFDDKKTAKQMTYPEMGMQLAAYARGLGMPRATLVNVFVSRTVPGLVVAHEWPHDTYPVALSNFLGLLSYWQHSKNYFPGIKPVNSGMEILADHQKAVDEDATVIDGNVIYQGDAQLASYGESPRAGRWVRLALDDVHTEGDPLVPFRQLNGDVLKVTVSTQDIGV